MVVIKFPVKHYLGCWFAIKSLHGEIWVQMNFKVA